MSIYEVKKNSGYFISENIKNIKNLKHLFVMKKKKFNDFYKLLFKQGTLKFSLKLETIFKFRSSSVSTTVHWYIRVYYNHPVYNTAVNQSIVILDAMGH